MATRLPRLCRHCGTQCVLTSALYWTTFLIAPDCVVPREVRAVANRKRAEVKQRVDVARLASKSGNVG